MALPRDDADRIAKYDAKVAPTTVGLKIAARLPGMKTDYASFATTYTAMQLLVRGQLAAVATIFPIDYGMYYAYASQLWKLLNTTSQPAANAMAQIIHDKWVTGRGADGPTCVAIAINVFSITVI